VNSISLLEHRLYNSAMNAVASGAERGSPDGTRRWLVSRKPLGLLTLIAGGSVADRQQIREVLTTRGHQVSECPTLGQVGERLDDEPYQLIVVDWTDPEPASELCRLVRAHFQGQDAVILAVCLAEMAHSSDELIDAGVNDIVIRPLDSNQLSARLGFLEQWAHNLMERVWAEEALRESEEEFRDLFESSPIGIYQSTPEGQILMANPQMARMLGYESFEEMASVDLEDGGFWPSYPREGFKLQLEREGEIRGYEAAWTCRDGRTLFVRESARVVRDGTGNVIYYTGAVEDITDQKVAEEALVVSEQRYALAMNGAKDGLWEWDLIRDSMHLSPRWKQMLGYEEADVPDAPDGWFSLVHPEDVDSLRAELASHLDGLTPHFEHEHRMLHMDGTWRWMLSRGLAVRGQDGHPRRMAGSQSDTTERRRAEEELLHHALHDRLTGLPNRALLMDRLRRATALANRRQDYTIGVVFLDLDRFKLINESLGHELGEKILVQIAQRLESCMPQGDTVARVGGDKFALLLEGIESMDEARATADAIQVQLAQAIWVGGSDVFVTASMGIACSTQGYDRAADMMRDAEVAMYKAKSKGRACHAVFDPSMRERAVAWMQIESYLRHAVDREELRLYYQPIISLATGNIVGFEALVRWQHPELGLISPTKFVHIAEETGLIVPIGKWVLQEACLQLQRWRGTFSDYANLTINVNLSGRQFSQQDLVKQVEQVIEETDIDPRALKLEITESVLMEDRNTALKALRQLKELNVQLSIDDFGTGYSSFSHLELFPVDSLKIDRSFINRMGTNGENTEIVDTIVNLGRTLGLTVVAEGVETVGQLNQLRTSSCELAQGYLFAKPMNHQDVDAILLRKPHW
jgi:diguanylate cyclase (GGDEF)-like protein/PAS domain S-box-containing protein